MRGTEFRGALAAMTAAAIALSGCGSSNSAHSRHTAAAASTAPNPATHTPTSRGAATNTPTVVTTPPATATGASTTAPASASASAIPPAFRIAMHRIEGPYKAMAAAVVSEMERAGSQSDTVFAARINALAARAGQLENEISAVNAPAALNGAMSKLFDGTTAIVADLRDLASAASTHDTSFARQAATALRDQAFVEVAAGIAELKRAGLR